MKMGNTVKTEDSHLKIIPVGFAIIILMMILLTVVGIFHMQKNVKLMEQVVSDNNVKIELVRNMYTAARERSVLLMRMMIIADAFEIDEDLYIEFFNLGGQFLNARNELSNKSLDEYERKILEEQNALSRVNGERQNQVMELLRNDEIEKARQLFFEKVLSDQDTGIKLYNKLLKYEQDAAKAALESADQLSQNTIRFMYFASASTIIFSFLVALYVVSRARRDQKMLIEARNNLEDKVTERTRQLSEAFEDLKQHKSEIEDKNTELTTLSNKLSKYLSPQVYSSIFSGEKDVKLGSQRKKLTVLFSDIVGFTSSSDRLEAEDLTYVLNSYFTEMTSIVLEHGGTIDKFIGDAIMLFFGDPQTQGVKSDALACVKTAIAMQNRLTELHEIWRKDGLNLPIRIRVGIHTGYCTVGNFGSEDRMDYTIIGSTVNLASRLEHEAEPGGILISGDTQVLIEEEIDCEFKGTVDIRGLAYPVETYKVHSSIN